MPLFKPYYLIALYQVLGLMEKKSNFPIWQFETTFKFYSKKEVAIHDRNFINLPFPLMPIWCQQQTHSLLLQTNQQDQHTFLGQILLNNTCEDIQICFMSSKQSDWWSRKVSFRIFLNQEPQGHQVISKYKLDNNYEID